MNFSLSEKLRQPSETVRVAHFPNDRAHEDLNRADIGIPLGFGVFAESLKET